MTGAELRKLRKEANITQNDIAKLMGTTYQTISKYEGEKGVPPNKMAFVTKFYQELEKHIEESDFVFEGRSEYQKIEKKSNEDIIHLIFSEIKEVRKENKQLNESIAQIKEDNSNERKMNDLLRKQLQLAINVLKNLDLELNEREKSTSAKQNISKIK